VFINERKSSAVDAFFLPADGLPEDIAAREFQNHYGVVGGPGHQRLIDDIHRRLDALPNP